jgi:hypothetical protein
VRDSLKVVIVGILGEATVEKGPGEVINGILRGARCGNTREKKGERALT